MNEPAGGERIVAHLAFARAVASRSLDPRCRGADREDLIAWGVFGLVQAKSKMRPLRRGGDSRASWLRLERERRLDAVYDHKIELLEDRVVDHDLAVGVAEESLT